MSLRPQPLLAVRDLEVEYPTAAGPVRAVAGLSFEIAPGEAVGVLGASGCGKTSLALAVAGLLPPAARRRGEILFRGRRLDRLREADLGRVRGAEIGVVFQEPALALHPTRRIGDQVVEVLRAHRDDSRWSRRRGRDEAAALLAEVDLTAEDAAAARGYFDAYPHQLSGGQRQRVVLAQALACAPDLLLADEPTAALDTALADGVLALLRRVRESRSLPLLVISHDPRVLAASADRILVIEEGRRVDLGPTAEVLERARVVEPEVERMAPSPETVLSAEGLRRTYRRGAVFHRRAVRALDGVGLELRAGSIVGLVGPSGSGKSTLARCLALLEVPDTGTIRFEGEDVLALGERGRRRIRTRVQLLFQDPAAAMNPRLSVAAAIAEPMAVRGHPRGAERRDRVRSLMDEVGLEPDLAERRPLELSGGQKQRLALARALAAEPRVLIFDEGLSALDLSLRARMVDLLLRLRRDRRLAYLVISHDRRFVERLADRVLVLDGGRLVGRDGPGTARAGP